MRKCTKCYETHNIKAIFPLNLPFYSIHCIVSKSVIYIYNNTQLGGKCIYHNI